MQLHQLRYLIAAAECGSFRAAAQKLYVTQSTLSTAIRELEQETATKIFTRSSHGITLTNAGAELLGYARQIIEQVDLMESRYSREKRGKETRFMVSSQHYSVVIRAFADFLKQHEDDEATDFTLRETHTDEIIRDVQSGRADLGIIYLSNYNDQVIKRALDNNGLVFMSLFVASPHVFVAEDHPLAGQSSVTPEELANYRRYEHEQGTENSSYYSEEPLSTIPHRHLVTVSDNNTLVELLTHDQGYTVATGVFPEDTGAVSIPIETDEIMNVGYVMRQGTEPVGLVDEFLRLLSNEIMKELDLIEPSSIVFDYCNDTKSPSD